MKLSPIDFRIFSLESWNVQKQHKLFLNDPPFVRARWPLIINHTLFHWSQFCLKAKNWKKTWSDPSPYSHTSAPLYRRLPFSSVSRSATSFWTQFFLFRAAVQSGRRKKRNSEQWLTSQWIIFEKEEFLERTLVREKPRKNIPCAQKNNHKSSKNGPKSLLRIWTFVSNQNYREFMAYFWEIGFC